MMRIRFDIWDHIERIRLAVENPINVKSHAKNEWYLIWACIFRSLGVDNIFTYATVIHRVQFFLAGIMIYISSMQILIALLIKSENNRAVLRAMALSSLLIWFTMTGTLSFFQQAWIMWYSVNYKFTIVDWNILSTCW